KAAGAAEQKSQTVTSRPQRMLKILGLQIMLICVTVLMFDAACYALLPANIAIRFPGYKDDNASEVSGAIGYSRDYYVRHPERGFDIGPGRRGTHVVDGVKYPIWGNGYGCFDKDWEQVPKDYYYFAGDSMTWGYTPFEDKFPTVYERLTGKSSFK